MNHHYDEDISSSTLIIDPLTYKQVADNYIASKKKPVRRTHTCNPYIGSSDLVCDSNRLKVVQVIEDFWAGNDAYDRVLFTILFLLPQNKNQSTSCPSSPLGPGHERKSSNSSSKAPPPSPTGTPFSESPSSDCSIFSLDKSSPSEVHDANLSWNVENEIPSSTLSSHHQYQELLNNLDNLQVSSSPS
ncbi:hypothetical protein Avbf_04732 [Armadillidium vulgare]|nr:hypothetical protein Avbf_04732 [Armadillidium vulgare]